MPACTATHSLLVANVNAEREDHYANKKTTGIVHHRRRRRRNNNNKNKTKRARRRPSSEVVSSPFHTYGGALYSFAYTVRRLERVWREEREKRIGGAICGS